MPQLPTDLRVERRDRSIADAGVELRAAADGAPSFFGHAAVVNSRTAIGDPLSWGFFEEVSPEAFARTLQSSDARFLIDHDSSKVVARQSAGDLRVGMDDKGLFFEADLDQELSYVRDLTRNLEKRRITGMSFGFIVRKDEWRTVDVTATDEAGKEYTAKADLRVIQDLDLIEGSAVTFPAYEETDAALRAIQLSPEALSRRADMIRSSSLNRRQVGRALDLMNELRAGKVLSAANLSVLQSVLDQLAAADEAFDPLVNAIVAVDDALDSAQSDISNLIGVADPDANDPDGEMDAGMRSASGGPVPTADYVRALAARHGLTGR